MRDTPTRFTALSVAIGERLRELRQDAELKQAEVARRCKVPRPIITRVERGMHTISLDLLHRYAQALELDIPTVLALVDIEELVAIDFPPWQGPERPLVERLRILAELPTGKRPVRVTRRVTSFRRAG